MHDDIAPGPASAPVREPPPSRGADGPLDRNLGFLLHDAARLLRKRFDQRARSLGLTRSQWQVLAHVSRREGLSQSALAEILEVEPITLARLVDRLEAASMIERRTSPADRRVRLLHLAPAARPVLARMHELGAETRAEATAGFSAEDRERLLDLLAALKANLCEPAAPGAAREGRVSHG